MSSNSKPIQVLVVDDHRIFAESLSRLVSLVKADAAAIVLREGAQQQLVPASTSNIEPETAMSIAAEVLSAKTGDPDVVQRSEIPFGTLRSAAHVLRQTSRDPDITARYGGDAMAGILISTVYVGLFLAGILALGNLGYLQPG